jgi:tRNA threonylcarbamoyladenosine biosynthesis protein TsaE
VITVPAGRKPPSVSVVAHDQFLTRSEFVAWGEALGRSLAVPSIVALSGDLGAGKTTLAQAICRGVGIDKDVTSPTFSLVNSYEVNGRTIYHLDLYRIDDPADLTNLSWDEIINSDAVVIVEWPEHAGDRFPAGAMRVLIEHVVDDADRRRVVVG